MMTATLRVKSDSLLFISLTLKVLLFLVGIYLTITYTCHEKPIFMAFRSSSSNLMLDELSELW